jgi:tRNA pseudouridine38-40 synthase
LAIDKYRAWHVINELDIDAMQLAANKLIGNYDFSSFRSAGCQANSPIKTLYRFKVNQSGENISIYVRSKSFLHNQVRIMVGTLVEVGKGRWSVHDFEAIRDMKDRTKSGPTAPAHGLYLIEVGY